MKIIMPFAPLGLCLCLLALSGCATQESARLYSGPELPREQVAVVKVQKVEQTFTEKVRGGKCIEIIGVDGGDAKRASEVLLLPGKHTIQLACHDGTGRSLDLSTAMFAESARSRNSKTLALEALAGHEYEVQFTIPNRGIKVIFDPNLANYSIIDVKSGQTVSDEKPQ